MFSQDANWGTFCPMPVIDFTLEASALINYTLAGCIIPPCLSISFHTNHPHFSVLLCWERHFSVSISLCPPRLALLHFVPLSIPPPHPHLAVLRWERCSFIRVSTPQPRLVLSKIIPLSSITFSVLPFSTQILLARCSSFPCSCSPFSSEYIRLPFKSHLDLQPANISLHLY